MTRELSKWETTWTDFDATGRIFKKTMEALSEVRRNLKNGSLSLSNDGEDEDTGWDGEPFYLEGPFYVILGGFLEVARRYVALTEDQQRSRRSAGTSPMRRDLRDVGVDPVYCGSDMGTDPICWAEAGGASAIGIGDARRKGETVGSAVSPQWTRRVESSLGNVFSRLSLIEERMGLMEGVPLRETVNGDGRRNRKKKRRGDSSSSSGGAMAGRGVSLIGDSPLSAESNSDTGGGNRRCGTSS